jgi:hypothetical protein
VPVLPFPRGMLLHLVSLHAVYVRAPVPCGHVQQGASVEHGSMQATQAVKDAEAEEQKQSQEIRNLEKAEGELQSEHRFVATQRAKLEKELHKVTEEAQASRCCLSSLSTFCRVPVLFNALCCSAAFTQHPWSCALLRRHAHC